MRSLPLFALSIASALALPVSAQQSQASNASVAHGTHVTDIVDIAIGSPDHTTLVAAVQAADLVETLKGAGPFTVFAPTDAAFQALPAGTVDTLLKPESKSQLTEVLTYHVVAGRVDAASLTALIEAGNGRADVTTIQGGTLVAQVNGGGVTLTDANGNTARVTATDLAGSNGVIHVIDAVVLP